MYANLTTIKLSRKTRYAVALTKQIVPRLTESELKALGDAIEYTNADNQDAACAALSAISSDNRAIILDMLRVWTRR